MKKLFPLLIVFVCMCSGCASTGMVGSYCGPVPELNALGLIADDAVSCLTDIYPPGHTAIYLLPAQSTDNGFQNAFDARLRASGFTVLANENSKNLSISYTFDVLSDERTGEMAYYLQLRLSNGLSFSRSYTASGLPEGSRTQSPYSWQAHIISENTEQSRYGQ